MRKYILATILLLASVSLFAACPVNEAVANGAAPCVSGFNVNPATITARCWIQGFNNVAEGAGTDSDGIPSVDQVCAMNYASVLMWGGCAGFPGDQYFMLTDWLTLAYDGCPLATGFERATLLAYDPNGNYILQSLIKNEGFGNWDNLGTQAAAPLSEPAGALSLTGDEVGNQVDVTFAFSNYFLYGNYDVLQPASPIPTQYNVYFYETAGAVVPPVFDAASWTLGGTYPIATSSISNMAYPALGNVNNRLYMSINPVFEGTTFPWVSNAPVMITASVLDPSGAPVISSIKADKAGLETNVTWTSSDESKVTGYQVFWAPMGSEFTAIGSRINPAGNNHTYTTSVRIPATGSYSVKVGAYLVDGNVDYSSIANVSGADILIKRARTTPN